MRQRHFAGTKFKPHNLPENAATPTRRVHVADPARRGCVSSLFIWSEFFALSLCLSNVRFILTKIAVLIFIIFFCACYELHMSRYARLRRQSIYDLSF
jgi:hypothetical protein